MKCTYQIGQSLIAGVLSIAVLATSSGCTLSTVRFSKIEEIRRQTRTVAVVPANAVVRTYFEPAFARGKVTGASKGAGLGAVYGFFGSFDVLKGGELAIFIWPIVAPITTIAGAVGGAQGGSKAAVPSEDVEAAQGLICEDGSKNIQESFAQHLLTAGTNITGYRFQIAGEAGKPGLGTGNSADLTVETEISSVGFVGGEGKNPAISLSIDATVKAMNLSGDTEVYRGQKRYISLPKPLGVWAENKAALLKQEVDAALTSIAEQAADELFLVHDFYSGARRCLATAGPDDAKLLWEAFPTEQDRKSEPEGAGRISEVRYDVMVWRASLLGEGRPDPEVIYEDGRFAVHHVKASQQFMPVTTSEQSMNPTGEVIDSKTIVKNVLVAEPDQKIQLALNADYECSIRARFKLDGKTRMTNWSPHYRFTTPVYKELPLSQPTYTSPVQVTGKTFHTRVNIWHDYSGRIYSTNFHEGTMLPIGTKIRIAEIVHDNPLNRYVRFEDGTGKSYVLIFQMRHERSVVTPWHLFDHYFTFNDPLAEGGAFRALSPEEQENVRTGSVDIGMSKAAVIMAFGYPPGHKTPSLEHDAWIYWLNGKQTRTVRFEKDRVVN
jgi:hypothetical protein